MIRKIIHIDTDACTGCGLCAEACHEGAIQMIDGKAVLTREDYCDGLGDCLPACPAGAISFVEREAPAYDHAAVQKAKKALEHAGSGDSHCACPSAASRSLSGSAAQNQAGPEDVPSCLSQWPVQIKLAPIHSPYFANADLLMAYSEVDTRQAKVPLIFKHMLAKLTVKVNTGAVSTTISKTSVSMENAIKDYTVTYTGTGTLSGDSPAKITTGSTRNATFTPHTESTESNGKVYVYSVILPAQDISSAAAKVKTTITIGSPGSTEDLVYTYAPDPDPLTVTKLANGKNTILTLTVNGTVLELGDVKVTNWNEVSADGNISLDK